MLTDGRSFTPSAAPLTRRIEVDASAVAEAEAGMDRALAGLYRLFMERPVRQAWLRIDCHEYIVVQRNDGSIAFEVDPAHAERRAWLAQFMDPVFGSDADMPEVEL